MSGQANLTLGALSEAMRATLPPWRRWADETKRRCALLVNEYVAPEQVIVFDGVDWHRTGWMETTVAMRRETYVALLAAWEVDEVDGTESDIATACAYYADQRRKADA